MTQLYSRESSHITYGTMKLSFILSQSTRLTDGQTDGQMEGQTDGQTDGQNHDHKSSL